MGLCLRKVDGMGFRGGLADFGAFYERTYPVAFRVAYGLVSDRGLADDVVHDAYTMAFRERGRFREEGPVEAWLYRIVVRTAVSFLRRQRIRLIVPIDPLDAELPDRADSSSAVLDRMTLADALRRLDHRARAVVVLRYYLDLDYATIGSIVGTSADNVGAILTRSRARLRALMEAEPVRARVGVVVAKGADRNG